MNYYRRGEFFAFGKKILVVKNVLRFSNMNLTKKIAILFSLHQNKNKIVTRFIQLDLMGVYSIVRPITPNMKDRKLEVALDLSSIWILHQQCEIRQFCSEYSKNIMLRLIYQHTVVITERSFSILHLKNYMWANLAQQRVNDNDIY